MKRLLSILVIVLVLSCVITLNSCFMGNGGNTATTTQPNDGPAEEHTHTYTAFVTEPTCTERGYTTFSCSCGANYKLNYVEPTGHTYNSEVTLPTCTEQGYTTYSCDCGDSYIADYVEIDPNNHTSGEWRVEKAATCTENGTNGKYCIACGEKMDSAVTFSTGHVISITVVQELSCTEDGIVRHECTVDGCEYFYEITTKAEHNVQFKEKQDATCTLDGYIKYGCTKCDYEEITVMYGGHSYTSEITKEPTQSSNGEMLYTCSYCNDSYTEEIPMLKQGIYALLIEDTAPWRTNTNAELLTSLVNRGYIAYWDRISSSKLDSADLSKYGIILIANDQNSATYKNIVANKNNLQIFARDGGVLLYGACDQGWSSGSIDAALLEGIAKGNYYSYRNYIVNADHPIVTGALTDGISLTNELLYHNYTSHTYFTSLPEGSNIILQDANGNPTLVEYEVGSGYVIVSGLTWEHNAKYEYNDKGSYSNTAYDDLIIYATTLINACEHQYEESGSKEATCTESGYTLYTCALCGFAYKDAIVQPLGHTLEEWTQTKAPTCTEMGEESNDCSVCGETQTRNVDATGHNEGEWIVDIEPTCTTVGSKHTTCEICGETISTEAIPTLDHTESEWIIDEDSNCYKIGYKHKECLVCGVVIETEIIDLLEHTYQFKEEVNATCTQDGYILYICSACGFRYKDNIVKSFGHNVEKWTQAVAPTCTKEGEEIGACSVCGETQIRNVDATGHDEGEWIVDIESTCTTVGSQHIACEICGETIKTETIPALDHIESEWIVDKEPTETEDASKHIECTVCGTILKTEIVEIYYSKGLEFTLNKDGQSYSVTDIGICTDIDVVIPAKYKGLPVTGIGDRAFDGCDFLASINIPCTVATIGNRAFFRCPSLSNICVSENNEYYKAINGNLYSKNGETLIRYAIGKQDSSFVISDFVVNIGVGAFEQCDSLINVEISDSVRVISAYAFAYCNSLASIEIPDSVTSIGNEAFYSCDSLAKIEFGNSVITIGAWAFIGCNALKKVELPNSVEYIGPQAFTQCQSLESIVIPASLTNIGYRAFMLNPSLVSIEVDENNPSYKSVDGNLYTKDGKILIQYAVGKPDSSFVIPNSVTSIEYDAFAECTSLTNVVIPDSMTSIARGAFHDCYSLASVIISNSVTSIGDSAFWNCAALTSVEFGDNSQLTSIGDSAFWYCAALTSVEFGDNSQLTSIGDGAFSSCTSLTSIVIPDSVTSIGDCAFYNCDSLTSMVIPDFVTSIGSGVFWNCDSLASVVIGDSVTSIGEEAFRNCDSLTSVVIPDSVTSIGEKAFYSCENLTIYCVAESKPDGWHTKWNSSNRPVVWGYTGE